MTHLHLMLTHVPVIGTAFALVLLVVALARRSDELKKAALWAFAVATLIAIPVYLTGEPAECWAGPQISEARSDTPRYG